MKQAVPERLQIATTAGRCPYCHDSVPVAERAACAACLAPHHQECWREQGACAACGDARALVPEVGAAGADDLVDEDLLGVAQAGARLQVHRSVLLRLVSEGALRAKTIDGELGFDPADLDALRPRLDEALDGLGGEEEWLDVTAAAARLRLSPRDVRRLVGVGGLDGRQQAGVLTVRARHVQTLAGDRLYMRSLLGADRRRRTRSRSVVQLALLTGIAAGAGETFGLGGGLAAVVACGILYALVTRLLRRS